MAVRWSIALFLSFALTHVLALLCFSVPAVAGAVIHATTGIDPDLDFFFIVLSVRARC